MDGMIMPHFGVRGPFPGWPGAAAMIDRDYFLSFNSRESLS